MFTNNKLNKNKLNVFRYQKQLRLKGKYSNLKKLKQQQQQSTKTQINPATNFS